MTELSKKERVRQTRAAYYQRNKEKQKEHRRQPEIAIKLKEAIAKYRQKFPWLTAYYYAKRKCEDQKHIGYSKEGRLGIKFEITREQMQEVWNRDNGSNLNRPILQRIDSTQNYTVDNVRFVQRQNKKEYTVKETVEITQ